MGQTPVDPFMAVIYAKVPKKRPRLCALAIRDHGGNRRQYIGRALRPDEGCQFPAYGVNTP
jgi:hypothetical protein